MTKTEPLPSPVVHLRLAAAAAFLTPMVLSETGTPTNGTAVSQEPVQFPEVLAKLLQHEFGAPPSTPSRVRSPSRGQLTPTFKTILDLKVTMLSFALQHLLYQVWSEAPARRQYLSPKPVKHFIWIVTTALKDYKMLYLWTVFSHAGLMLYTAPPTTGKVIC